jgi:hypothetical protein
MMTDMHCTANCSYTGTEGAPLRKLAEAEAALEEATLTGVSDGELQRLESNVTDKKDKYSKTKWGTLTSTQFSHRHMIELLCVHATIVDIGFQGYCCVCLSIGVSFC